MIVGQYPCPECNRTVAAMPGQTVVCPGCTHEWRVRPSTLDAIWFGKAIHPVNPLPIYLSLEKWLSRDWAGASCPAPGMLNASLEQMTDAAPFAAALRDVVRLRVQSYRALGQRGAA